MCSPDLFQGRGTVAASAARCNFPSRRRGGMVGRETANRSPALLDYLAADPAGAVPITPVRRDTLAKWVAEAPEADRAWLKSTGFSGESGKMALLPGAGGALGRVLVGVPMEATVWDFAGLPDALPEGTFRIDAKLDGAT